MADKTAIHPGAMIKTELAVRGWTQNDLAAILGRSPQHVSDVVRGKAGISVRMARDLAAAFDTTAMFWLEAWTRYRLGVARPHPPVKPPIKRWTLEELRERYDSYAVGENHHGHGYIGCFLDWLETP